MKFHAVVNPVGASGRTLKKFNEILPVMQAQEGEVEVHYSTKETGIGGVCRQLTKDLLPGEIINLIIVGGDGSLNDALNGIEHLEQVHLGLLPAGSGNDLAKGLGLDDDLAALAKEIMQGKVKRTMDIGEITYYNTSEELVEKDRLGRWEEDTLTRRFHDSTGMGFDAAICQAADASRFKKVLNKLHLGKLIYILCAIRLVFSAKRPTLSVINDGRETKYDGTLLFVAMNNPYEGGGFKFCPDADNNDGLLDLCIATPKSNAAFFKIFPSGYDGSHVKFPVIHMDRGADIHVKSSAPQWVHTDGEVVCKSDEISIRILKEKISLLF